MNLYVCLACLVVEAIILCLIFVPKIKQARFLDKEIENKNLKIAKELQETEKNYYEIREKCIAANDAYENLIKKLSEKQVEADTQSDNYYKQSMATAEARITLDTMKIQQNYECAKKEYQDEYTSMLKDLTNEYVGQFNSINDKIESTRKVLFDLNKTLLNEQSIVSSAVEANKRAVEMEQKRDFYKIKISKEDVNEINELRKCFSHLRNPVPLNKVIWKVYYENPTNDLIGRVIGSGNHCGIYKITNTKNQMCYVGQSNQLGERWKQHIKRGIGADTPTKNKLYPAMLEDGIENFTFEVIEECPQDLLNEKEKFWTEYFKAQEFGYSIRKG